MERIVIIADDLTGACDTGIQFRKYGWETNVFVTPASCRTLAEAGSPVISLNTDTRSVSADAAYEAVSSALKSLKDREDTFFYKKVDSVLRGNISSELEACFQTLGFEFALIAPAFPEASRCVRGGRLYIGSGEAMQDLGDARMRVSAGSRRGCELLPLETVRSGTSAVIRRLEALTGQGATLILADCCSSEDLSTIAEAALHFGRRCISVGSAGLAGRLAELFGKNPKQKELHSGCRTVQDGALMVVVGTRHPATVAQVQRLKAEEPMDTYLLTVEGISQENVPQRVDTLIGERQSPGRAKGILVTTDLIYDGKDVCRHLLQHNAYNRSILNGIGMSVKKLMERGRIRGLIVSGGDVASEILCRLHFDRISLMDEPIPGIVIGEAMGENISPVLLATKSGGFGDENALLKLYRYMNGLDVLKGVME